MSAPRFRELYRDPIYDGATDPLVVVAPDGWWMFYTQRRATHPDPGPGVAWVHGSRIGVAHSPDGVSWTYAGSLEPTRNGLVLDAAGPPVDTDRTHWAPEVIHDGTRWRMYLTEIDGVPDRWPGHARRIVEYASDDLRTWHRRGPLPLPGDRAIDAAVARTPDGWRLWYKDEAAGSITRVAASTDLDAWQVTGTALGGRPHEGPSVFELGGFWWLVVDEWRGMAVYRSPDARSWTRQGGPDAVVLGIGHAPAPGFGHHGAAVHDGEQTWFFFFGHPQRTSAPSHGEGEERDDVDARRCAVYRARLRVQGGALVFEPEGADGAGGAVAKL